MPVVRSKKDRLKEQAEHPGQEHYKIFYKDGDKKVEVFDFWAATEQQALDELEIYRKKQELVCPTDAKTYYYGRKGGIITDLGNGMERESDGFGEGFLDDDTAWEKITGIFWKTAWWFRDLKYAFVDFWFWFRHYDMRTNKSHNRSESWNIDSHILDDIEFNIPRLIESKQGVPTEFCCKARAKLHENEPGFDVEKSYRANPNSSDDELSLASELWTAELNALLLHVRLYRFYEDHGLVDDRDPAYVSIEKEYGHTIPYKPGTDKSIDYEELFKLTGREWSEIWKWWAKYGRCCWD